MRVKNFGSSFNEEKRGKTKKKKQIRNQFYQ